MELAQADKQVLTHFFGEEKVNELSGALKSDDRELSLGLNTGGKKLMSTDEIQEATKANQDAYIEIGYKKVAKEAGIELSSGEKDPSIIVDKLRTGITTTLEDKYKNMTPSDELEKAMNGNKEWEEKYNTLHGTYNKTLEDLDEANNNFTGLQTEIKTKEYNNSILKSLPEKAKVNKEHAVLIINNTLDKEDNNGIVTYKAKDGKPYLDPIGNPLELKEIVPILSEEFGWIKSSGMGGGDRGKSKTGLPNGLNESQAIDYLNEKGIDPMSMEGSKTFAEITKT